jgi:hypothetical protein
VAEDIGHSFLWVFSSMSGIFTLKRMEMIGEVVMINWHLAEGPK